MKKTSTFLFVFLFIHAIQLIAQHELVEITLARKGNSELLESSLKPLDPAKAIVYDSLNMQYAGGWSLGQSFCIASNEAGDLVFAGSGAGVILFNAADPYNLVKLSEIHARALVDAIHYDEGMGWLYLAAYFSGLEVWDVSDLENPYRLSRIGTTGLSRGGVYVPPVPGIPGQMPYAYLVTVADGIDVFSIDTWGQPTFEGNQNFTGSMLIWNSYGKGDTLFLSAGNGGTKAIDVSSTMANLFTVPGYATSIAARGNYLYVVDYNNGLKIHDITTIPASLLGQVSLPGFPYRLCLAGDYTYVANSTTNPGGGINIIETADPENPIVVGDYANYQTFIAGNATASFSTGSPDGLVALDLTDPSAPQYASNYKLPLSANDIAVRDDYAYMGNNGFRVFDVSDKSNPQQVGYHQADGALVKLSGNQALTCPKSMGSSNKINIMDISDPYTPEKLAHITAPYMTYDIDIKGKTAYVACWWDGIRVVDFSDPASPAWGTHTMGWTSGATPGEEWLYCQALDVSGDYLYAVDYGPFEDEDTRGIYVFDISNPLEPVLVKRFPDYTGKAYDIEVSNGFAYIADSEGGLSIVSVEDPLSPFQVSYLPLGDVAYGIDVFGTYAFIANYILEGVQVIDVSNPMNPQVEGYYKRSGCFALNVTYNAGHVFVSDGPAGMQIYNFDLLNGVDEPCEPVFNPFTCYPNPANHTLHIETTGPASIAVYQLNGQRIYSTVTDANGHNPTLLDLAHLPRGIYLLRVMINGEQYTEKIILQ